MHLKWFRGKAMPEVMGQIRRELGPDAVILHSKQSRPWGPLRAVRSGDVEILAAVDRAEAPSPAGGARAVESPSDSHSLRAEVARLRNLMVQFGGGRLLPPALSPCYERLVSGGVEPGLALRVLSQVPPVDAQGGGADGDAEHHVGQMLARMIRTVDPTERPGAARVALVGPAGAGKTTTVAKLAARLQIAGGRPGILNLDGSGFSEPAPIEAFAAILDAPYGRAVTLDEVVSEIRRVPAGGLTLVDTPGIGLADADGLAGLADLVRATGADEVHLVLAATTRTADAMAAVRAFSPAGITHLLFTRLDETTSAGTVLAVGIETGLPLSYFGTGRGIPADLTPAAAEDVVHRTLGRGGSPA